MDIRLSSKLTDTGDGALIHWCPGCKNLHQIETQKRNARGAIWSFDGNAEAPTFSPSINIVGQCHYFIRGGQMEFCSDSRHELAGRTVPLPDLPEWA